MSRLLGLTCAVFIALSAVALAAASTDGSKPAPPSLAKLVTHVPASTLDQIGAGPIKRVVPGVFGIVKLNGAPYGIAKPILLAGELAWCPHCAANDWALAVALSRFGKLRRLRVIDTGTYYANVVHAHPAFSHTQGISFFGASYSSPVLGFQNAVISTVDGKPLQKFTKAQTTALGAFDPNAEFPVADVGGVYGFVGSAFSPGLLHGKSASQIASSLANPSSAVAKSIDGLANVYAAAICVATHGLPTSVCRSKGVVAGAKVL
ncbi:MAG: DUF929 family protein [Solirubrobacteraceae bacterium]